jgi:hypothetical protein
MLTRNQILLEDWQTEYLKLLAKQNDFSFSETVRVVICTGILHTAPAVFPEHKSKLIKEEELLKLAIEGCDRDTSQQRRYQLISKLYFEARKATELMSVELKKMLKQE